MKFNFLVSFYLKTDDDQILLFYRQKDFLRFVGTSANKDNRDDLGRKKEKTTIFYPDPVGMLILNPISAVSFIRIRIHF